MRKVSGPIMTVSETYSALDLIGSGETGAITATPIAVPLSAKSVEVLGILIQNSENSDHTAYWGTPYHQWMELRAGDQIVIAASNPSLVYVRTGAGSATINWAAFAAERLV